MSLPPPPNLAVEVDKCLYLPRQQSVRYRQTLKVISRPVSARAAGKKWRRGHFKKRTMTVLTTAAAVFPLSGTILL